MYSIVEKYCEANRQYYNRLIQRKQFEEAERYLNDCELKTEREIMVLQIFLKEIEIMKEKSKNL